MTAEGALAIAFEKTLEVSKTILKFGELFVVRKLDSISHLTPLAFCLRCAL